MAAALVASSRTSSALICGASVGGYSASCRWRRIRDEAVCVLAAGGHALQLAVGEHLADYGAALDPTIGRIRS